jgi:ribose 5-phosphate isomerase
MQNLHEILGSPNAKLRMAVAKAGPVVTDNGNFVIDAPFERELMENPYAVRSCDLEGVSATADMIHRTDPLADQNAYWRRRGWVVLPYGTGRLFW